MLQVTKDCKGLFTRTDPVPVTVKVYHCGNGNRQSDGKNGLHTLSARQTVRHHIHTIMTLNGDGD